MNHVVNVKMPSEIHIDLIDHIDHIFLIDHIHHNPAITPACKANVLIWLGFGPIPCRVSAGL